MLEADHRRLNLSVLIVRRVNRLEHILRLSQGIVFLHLWSYDCCKNGIQTKYYASVTVFQVLLALLIPMMLLRDRMSI